MKKTFRLLALLMLVVALCFTVISCNVQDVEPSVTTENSAGNNGENPSANDVVIENDFGAEIKGGGFKEGAVLKTDPLAIDNEERENAIDKVVNYGVPLAEKAVAVYDINATQDGVEVQPNGNVRVTIPAPIAEITSYDVFHITDGGDVEILDATTKEGKITFETSSFSKFLVASKVNVDIVDIENAPSYVTRNNRRPADNTSTVTINAMYSNFGMFTVGKNATQYFTWQNNLAVGTKLTLKAIPKDGFRFVKWTVDGVTLSRNETIEYTVAEGSNQIYVQFEEIPKYTITVTNVGFDYSGGSISINDGMYWGTSSATVDAGETVTIRFKANDGYRFVGLFLNEYEETPITTASEYTFTAESHRSFVTRFEKIPQYNIVVSNVGYDYSGGSISINGGMYWGSSSATVTEGETVTIRFRPNVGYRFVGLFLNEYEETPITTASEYTFTAESDRSFVTRFEKIPQYNIVVSNVGYDYSGGSISINGGMYWGSSSATVTEGETVTIRFRPNDGYRFVGLFLNEYEETPITTASEYTFTAESDRSFVTRFEKIPQYNIVVSNVGYDYSGGSISINGGMYWGSSSATVTEGETVTIRFRPNVGYRFVGLFLNEYEETPITTASEYTFTAESDRSFVTRFEPCPTYTVNILPYNYDTAGGGFDINGIRYAGQAIQTFSENTTVTLNFYPAKGYYFAGLYAAGSEEPVTTDSEYSFTLTNDVQYWAKFEKLPSYNLQINPVGIDSWQFWATIHYTVDGSQQAFRGGTIQQTIAGGTDVKLAFAIRDESAYRFLGWYDGYYIDDANLLSGDREFIYTLNEETQIFAHFEEIPAPVITVDRFGGVTGSAMLSLNYNSKTYYHQNRIIQTVTHNTPVTISLRMNDNNYEFLGWYINGNLVSNELEYTFVPEGDTTLFTSIREKGNVSVTVGVNSNFAGSFMDEATGETDTYSTFKVYEGSSVLVSAIAKDRYEFVGWYVDEICITTDATINLNTFADGTYVQARFEKKQDEIGTVTNMWICDEDVKYNMNVGWYFEGDFASRTYTATITAGDENVSDINELYLMCVRFGVDGEKLLQPHYELDIELGNYDPDVAGVYEVYLTYREDPSVVLTLIITVI